MTSPSFSTSPVDPSHLDRASHEVVEALTAAEVRHLIIGSIALRAVAPELVSRPSRDLDLLLPEDAKNLDRAADTLVGLGYTLTSWKDRVTPPLDAARLAGRFYLRAQAGPLIVDLTYECPWLDFDSALTRAVIRPPFTFAHLDDLLTLLAARDLPRDRALLARLRDKKKS